MSLLTTITQSTLMGVVEGITEYLPISSTGHLILVKETFRFSTPEAFEVVIQSGAVLAVLVEYFRRFVRLFHFRETHGFAGFNGWLWLALTTLPACVLGLLFHGLLKDALFNTRTVLLSLAIGGVVMIVLERCLPDRKTDASGIDGIGWRRALGVGLFQCFAMIPGTSRSMSTILGGRLLGLDRQTAAEYSFFAAVPVLVLAGAWDLCKSFGTLTRADLLPFAVGTLVSFVVALLSIRFLIRMLAHHTMEAFGWYRIALALLAATLLFALHGNLDQPL